MTIVTIPLFVALPIILWNYRQSNKTSAYKPDWEYSRLLESLVWGLPALVVCMLGYNLWRESFALDPYRPLESNRAPIEIDAIGLDWKWVFIYPDVNVASVNEVVFPVGRPVRFRVTSGTVLQSFMIPRLGGQIYAMPGMVTEINLMTASTGVYRGLNTQFNGEGFARQKFAAKAVSAEDYHRWIAETTQKAPPLDARAMKTLRAQSVLAAPQRYGSVTGHLFDRLVAELQSTDTARVNEHETSPP